MIKEPRFVKLPAGIVKYINPRLLVFHTLMRLLDSSGSGKVSVTSFVNRSRELLCVSTQTVNNKLKEGMGLLWNVGKGNIYYRNLGKVLFEMGVTKKDIVSPVCSFGFKDISKTDVSYYKNFMRNIWKYVAGRINGLKSKSKGKLYWTRKLPNGDFEDIPKRVVQNLDELNEKHLLQTRDTMSKLIGRSRNTTWKYEIGSPDQAINRWNTSKGIDVAPTGERRSYNDPWNDDIIIEKGNGETLVVNRMCNYYRSIPKFGGKYMKRLLSVLK